MGRKKGFASGMMDVVLSYSKLKRTLLIHIASLFSNLLSIKLLYILIIIVGLFVRLC